VCDFGLDHMVPWFFGRAVPPNLLILSSSSHGNVPIPEMHNIFSVVKPLTPVRRFIFLGNLGNHKIRKKMDHWFKNNFGHEYYSGSSRNWVEEYRRSEIILSPRGNSRGCFRHYEILQMGLVPLIINDNKDWLPYKNSSLPWDDMIFMSSYAKLDNIKLLIANVSSEKISKMRETILRYRESHFTYEGIMNQVKLFMNSWDLESDLRCDVYSA
jgi:hypothetical protein